mgnify:CR=1 FL=1
MTLQQTASDYVRCDEEIAQAMKSIKVLREKKQGLEKCVLEAMQAGNIASVTAGGKLITLKHQTQLGSLNKEYIEATLKQFCAKPHATNPEQFAEQAAEALMTNRDVKKEKYFLKIKKESTK